MRRDWSAGELASIASTRNLLHKLSRSISPPNHSSDEDGMTATLGRINTCNGNARPKNPIGRRTGKPLARRWATGTKRPWIGGRGSTFPGMTRHFFGRNYDPSRRLSWYPADWREHVAKIGPTEREVNNAHTAHARTIKQKPFAGYATNALNSDASPSTCQRQRKSRENDTVSFAKSSGALILSAKSGYGIVPDAPRIVQSLLESRSPTLVASAPATAETHGEVRFRRRRDRWPQGGGTDVYGGHRPLVAKSVRGKKSCGASIIVLSSETTNFANGHVSHSSPPNNECTAPAEDRHCRTCPYLANCICFEFKQMRKCKTGAATTKERLSHRTEPEVNERVARLIAKTTRRRNQLTKE
uniref:Uncharacterized protein n=1 Tax=Trichuris muris TaxID=70415 RepID=A0A5S6R337_TRIMR